MLRRDRTRLRVAVLLVRVLYSRGRFPRCVPSSAILPTRRPPPDRGGSERIPVKRGNVRRATVVPRHAAEPAFPQLHRQAQALPGTHAAGGVAGRDAGSAPRWPLLDSSQSFVDRDASERRYRANRGTDESGSFRKRVACVLRQPPSRRRQRWSDFTGADATSGRIGEGGPVTLWGRRPTEFVTLLGLRADEQPRVWRILDRTLFAEGAGSPKCAIRTQPPGEHPYFPLADSGWTASDVDTYWNARGRGLQLPTGAGNCVFCFMKGTHDLRAVAQNSDPDRVADAPSDIGWWDSIERRYRRKAPARNGSGVTVFGFFGVNGPSYADIANRECSLNGRYTTGSPACDCTD